MESIIKWRTGKPTEAGNYLCTNTKGHVVLFHWMPHYGWGNYKVIAWCPLNEIEPYKEFNYEHKQM